MTIELIENKNEPVRTKITFRHGEYRKIPRPLRDALEVLGKHETSRMVYFIVDGDILNGRSTHHAKHEN